MNIFSLHKTFKLALSVLVLLGIARVNTEAIDALKIKRNSIDSIVKVVASAHRNYITTGIALEKDLILTSRKILNYPFQKLYIVTAKGKEYPAEIKGEDLSDSLLLLKIPKKVLKPFKFANRVEAGEEVVLLGGFYEEFPAVFRGIISGSGARGLFIDSSLVPGAIGGAVLNSSGKLLGILRGKIGFSEATFLENNKLLYKIKKDATIDLCLATPFKKLKYVFNSLKDFGKVKKSWLGITLKKTKDNHVIINNVFSGSPAKKFGLVPGDRIVRYNKKPISSHIELTEVISTTVPGEQIELEIARKSFTKKLQIRLEELKQGSTKQVMDIRTFSTLDNNSEFYDKFPSPVDPSSFNQFSWSTTSSYNLFQNFDQVDRQLKRIVFEKERLRVTGNSKVRNPSLDSEIDKLEKYREKHYQILLDYLKKRNNEFIRQINQIRKNMPKVIEKPGKIILLKPKKD